MRLIFLLLLLSTLLPGQESCTDKRERLKALETQRDAEDIGEVISWLTLTKPTSENKKQLDQQIRILKLEIQQCELDRLSDNSEK